jgi:hypothetical protein
LLTISVDVAVRQYYGTHHPMEEVHGFLKSH